MMYANLIDRNKDLVCKEYSNIDIEKIGFLNNLESILNGIK